MPAFSKHVLAAAILVALACGCSVGTQTALSWEQVTNNLLTEDSVNLSDELPTDLRNLRFLDATTGLFPRTKGMLSVPEMAGLRGTQFTTTQAKTCAIS